MAVAHVQDASNGATGAGTTVAVAFGTNVGSGSLIVVTTNVGGITTHSISDSLGTTYTEAAAAVAEASATGTKQFWGITGSAGANTVTLTIGTSGLRRGLTIREFTGSDAAPVDDTAVTNNGTGTSMACGSVTMTADGAIVTGWSHSSNQTTTLDTDYTGLEQNSTGRVGSGYRITTAITDEAIHTASASTSFGATTVTYKQDGGGAPAGQPYQKRLGGIPGMGIVQPGFTHTW